MQGKFNQYNITTELAKKHSHATYLASPTNAPERQVVLTVFSASLFRFPYERENLLEKAQRIKQFQHSHFVPILDIGIEEEQPFVVREYLPNGSLRSRLKQISPRRLDLRDALTIVSQVGEVLAYAHEHNVLHGNLKPENILFNTTGQIFLTDFYLVGRKDAIIRDQTSGEYAFCYLAPEQFAGGCDARSDQYALGCLAYELITGSVPFAAQSLASMMGQPNSGLPAPLSESVADLPSSLEVAVLKTLAKDPDERFFDFSLFLDVIQSVLSPPPAFPLLRSADSRKNRIISHPVQPGKAGTVSSPIRQHPAKRLAPQSLEPSEAFSSAEDNMAEPVVAPAIPGASIPGQAGTALLKAISLSGILTNEPAMITPIMKQEADNLLLIDEDADELSTRASTSSAQSKDTMSTMTSPSTKSTLVHGLPSARTVRTWYSRKILIGLMLLILVIGASSAYAIFSPFSTIQPDLLHHPVQVVKQGGVIPQIPLQGRSDTANGQNPATDNHTANGQNSIQNKSILNEQSPSQITSQISSSSPSTSSSSPSTSSSSPSTSSSSPSTSSSSPSTSSSSPSTSSSSQPSTTTTNMTIYFSGWTDNSPPGASIAYPQIHSTAGGTGTYSDPITFAASKNALSPGTIIYVSFLKKYFIMEDDCSDCDSAWNNNHSYEISLWTGGDANSSPSAQQSCEDSLTPSSPQPVEVQPASNLAIDTTPLFTDSGGCIKL